MKLAFAWTGTLLVGLLAACGSDGGSTVTLGPTSSGSSGRPSRPPSASSSASGGFVDPGEDFPNGCGGGGVALSESDLDEEIGWKPGEPAQGSCTETDLDQIDDNFSDPSLRSYLDLGKGLGDACRACVISKDTDAKWGPVVATAENGGETGFINYGACFGAIEGAPCGKAIQYETFCQNIACDQCGSQKERQECVANVSLPGQTCESFGAAKTKSCPSWTLNVKSCGEIKKAIKTLCGPPQ